MIPAEDSLAGKGYQKYLDYDIDIKKSESTFNTILGAHGAFYAIRRELFEPMPDYLINDDFYIPMKIVAKGYRAVYEDRAVVTDRIEYSVAKEFRRRVRIGFGNWQQIFEFRNLLSPYKGLLAWQFYSHKALRAVMPIVLIIAFTTSLLLEVATYKVFSWSFSLLLLLALVGWIIQGLRLRAGPLYIPFFLIMGNYAYLVGTIKFFFTNKKVEW
jgi:cellulose synthase/poly-beta-1,6-N-acetylglucosamine synthase-like glycosyltransferase